MELVSSHIVKKSDLGFYGNLYRWQDEKCKNNPDN